MKREFFDPLVAWMNNFATEVTVLTNAKLDKILDDMSKTERLKNSYGKLVDQAKSMNEEIQEQRRRLDANQERLEGILKENTETVEKVLITMRQSSTIKAEDIVAEFRKKDNG